MTDPLHRAARVDAPLDLAAVDRRAAQLRGRRALARGAAVAAVVVATVAGGLALAQRPAADRVTQVASSPSPAVSAEPEATVTPAASPPARPQREVAFVVADCTSPVVTATRTGPVETPGSERRASLTALYADLLAAPEDLVRSLRVTDGVAYVDFQPGLGKINNLSTSCFSTSFLDSTEATLRRHDPTVRDVRLALDGDPKPIWELLGRTCPAPCDPAEFTWPHVYDEAVAYVQRLEGTFLLRATDGSVAYPNAAVALVALGTAHDDLGHVVPPPYATTVTAFPATSSGAPQDGVRVVVDGQFAIAADPANPRFVIAAADIVFEGLELCWMPPVDLEHSGLITTGPCFDHALPLREPSPQPPPR